MQSRLNVFTHLPPPHPHISALSALPITARYPEYDLHIAATEPQRATGTKKQNIETLQCRTLVPAMKRIRTEYSEDFYHGLEEFFLCCHVEFKTK